MSSASIIGSVLAGIAGVSSAVAVKLADVWNNADNDTPVISIVNMALPSGDPNRLMEFGKILPEDIAETPSLPVFTPYDIAGRSSPPQSYSGGEARSISFTLSLHRDLFSLSSEKATSDNFNGIINRLRAMNYPVYTAAGVVSPKVFVKIGDFLRIRGIPQVTFNFKRPVSHQRFMAVDVTFTVTEVLDISWSATEVMEGMERFVIWAPEELR